MVTGSAPASRGVLIVFVACTCLLAVAGGRAVAEPTENRLDAFQGPPPPALVLDRLGGGRLAAADFAGRVVLVHFFATWCEPCRPELASLDRLRAEAPGIEVAAVSVAEVERRLDRFFAENPVRFPILLDRDRAASRAWAIDALPSTVVLDRAGAPRLAVRGDLDWQRPDVRAALDTLLTEPQNASGSEAKP